MARKKRHGLTIDNAMHASVLTPALAADVRLVLAGLRAVSVEATRRSGGLVEEDRAVFVALGDEQMPEAFAAYERLAETFGE